MTILPIGPASGEFSDRPVKAFSLRSLEGRATSSSRNTGAILECHLLLEGRLPDGPNHSGVELHGFLSYLIKCNWRGGNYRIFGYKGSRCG